MCFFFVVVCLHENNFVIIIFNCGQPAVMSLSFSGSPPYIVHYVVLLVVIVIGFGQINYDDDNDIILF